jgi:probable HAF family extracellular repeat protein
MAAVFALTATLGPQLARAEARPSYYSVQLPKSPARRYIAINNHARVLSMRQDSPALAHLNIVIENWSNGGGNYSEFRPGTLPGSTRSIATAFNDSQQIVGYAESLDSSGALIGPTRAFIYSNGAFTDLSVLPPLHLATQGSAATAINNRGDVVGVWRDANGTHGFLYSEGVITALGSLSDPGQDGTTPIALNENRQVAGDSRVTSLPNSFPHTFLAHAGTFTDIGVLPTWEWHLTADINDAGDIVGTMRAGNHQVGCFLYSNGSLRNMGVVGSGGGSHCRASQINNAGLVVGDSSSTPTQQAPYNLTAFVYIDGQMLNLNTLIAASDPLAVNNIRLADALAINDKGQILASTAEGAAGDYYLLTPYVASTDTAHFNFENGLQGWANYGEPIVNVTVSAEQVYAGAKSLAVRFQSGGFASIAVPGPSVPAGSSVAFHVFIPANAALDWIQPFVLEGEAGGWRWSGNWQPIGALQQGAWNTLTVQVPSDAQSIWSLGVELYASQQYTGTVHIDSVAF